MTEQNKRMNIQAIVTATLVASLISSPLTVVAQSLPSSIDPSRVGDRLERGDRAPVRSDMVIEQKGNEVAPISGSEEKAFTLQTVKIEGSTVYTDEQLAESYKEHQGQKVSFADLQRIAQALTTKYRNDGYILSRVVLKPQRVKDGIVTFSVIEGYINQIQLNGDVGASDKALLESYAEKIKAERPTRAKTMERYLLLMDDLPGVTARSIVKASASQPGASDLLVNVTRKMVEGSVKLDNRGNKFVGPYQLTGAAAVNSAFGYNERNTLRVVNSIGDSEEVLFGDYSLELQTGSEGGAVTGRVAATRTEPGSTLESLDIRGKTRLLDLGYTYPILRSRTENLSVSGAFRAQNTESDILSVNQFEDDIRRIELGGVYDKTDDWKGINQLGLTLGQGLSILGASEDGAGRSRVNGEHSFTRLNGSASRLQDITDDVSFLAALEGQWSADPLLSSEQFSIGGQQFGHAYDSSEILGDHGLASVFELRYGNGNNGFGILEAYQLYAFYDLGAVWLREPLVGENSRESASSAGVGTRFNLAENFSGSLELAVPLTRDVASMGDEDPRVFFGITKRF